MQAFGLKEVRSSSWWHRMGSATTSTSRSRSSRVVAARPSAPGSLSPPETLSGEKAWIR